MNSEERNRTYQITGYQLDTIVEVIDTLTLVCHTLRMPDEMPVTREVVGSAVSVAQDTLDRLYDYIIEDFPKVRPEQSELQAILDRNTADFQKQVLTYAATLERAIHNTNHD